MRKGRDMAKVVCVLYDDPINGYPTSYARDGLPEIHTYPDGQTLPTPKAIDFTPGHLLGSVRSEEHTSELQSLMRISYAVFCLKKKKIKRLNTDNLMNAKPKHNHETNQS